jgi:hypothetical protein
MSVGKIVSDEKTWYRYVTIGLMEQKDLGQPSQAGMFLKQLENGNELRLWPMP